MRNGDSDQVSEASDLYGDEFDVWSYRTDEHDIGGPVDRAGLPVVAIYVHVGEGALSSLILTTTQARKLASDLYTASADAETETW